MRSGLLAASAVLLLAIVPAGCAGTASSARAVDPEAAKAAKILAEAKPGEEIKSEDPNDPIICRNEADATTRIRKYKSCKHKSEWTRIERESQESVNNTIRNSGYNKDRSN